MEHACYMHVHAWDENFKNAEKRPIGPENAPKQEFSESWEASLFKNAVLTFKTFSFKLEEKIQKTKYLNLLESILKYKFIANSFGVN